MVLMLAGVLALFAAAAYAVFIAVAWVGVGLWKGGEWIVNWVLHSRDRRRARIEAELDRTQAELRGRIVSLVYALGMEAHEARKAMIRESYLARGEVPGS